MATNYDLKLVVDADTTEARRKLDALGVPSGNGATAPSGPAAPSPSPEAQEAAARVRKFRLDPSYKPNLSNNPDDFGKKAGDVAGKAIGKAVAGLLAHEVSATIFSGLKTAGGDNRTVNKAESTVGGALKYGTIGAMFGPIGAAIGGLVGAGVGYLQEDQRQKGVVEQRDLAVRDADYRRNVNTAVGMADSAFDKSLGLAGGSRQRAEMIRARRDEIANGNGQFSIKSLERALKNADPESSRGQSLLANLEMQKNRVAQLDSQLVEEGLAVAPGRLDPGDVTDSLAKRGIQVGGQVDVARVNEKIMGDVQGCRALLEKIANMGTDRVMTVESITRAVYN